jgi:hypothetical protein
VEARGQLDEELAILHRELGQDPKPATGSLHRMFRCRSNPVRGRASSGSVTRLPNNLKLAHRRC